MKAYVKPTLECISLRVEERLAIGCGWWAQGNCPLTGTPGCTSVYVEIGS